MRQETASVPGPQGPFYPPGPAQAIGHVAEGYPAIGSNLGGDLPSGSVPLGGGYPPMGFLGGQPVQLPQGTTFVQGPEGSTVAYPPSLPYPNYPGGPSPQAVFGMPDMPEVALWWSGQQSWMMQWHITSVVNIVLSVLFLEILSIW